MKGISRFLPVLRWAPEYNRRKMLNDAIAGLIVTIMLIPQSLAYALLAGLPPEMGLYASITPLLAYTLFGTSRSLSVGPVAIVALMTAAAIAELALNETEAITAAISLALLVGLILFTGGMLRLGFLANFLSHPVVSGFITASAVLIALAQVPGLIGVSASGHTLQVLLAGLYEALQPAAGGLHIPTAVLGLTTLLYLFWSRFYLGRLLQRAGIRVTVAQLITRLSPVLAVVASIMAAWFWRLDEAGVALVGSVPFSWSMPELPEFSLDLWTKLAGSAGLIAVICFIESVSVARGLAAKKRERIDPDQELVGLGAANLAAGISGGFPVAGGFSRSVINFDAGAATPAAGVFAAVIMGMAALLLLPVIAWLPKAMLAASIIAAVLSLIDLSILRDAWAYSKTDFTAITVTILLTLFDGVESGVAAGILVSVVMHLYKTSKPHVAIVGLVPGTQHFRNVNRHTVTTQPHILSLRIDESLYFANTRYLEDLIYGLVSERKDLKHVILMCNAVNEIDLSAMESLSELNERLAASGIKLHLSEVKGTVMDSLGRTKLLQRLSGQVFMTHFQAVETLR